ncbi:DUF4157 domain-containing protein [Cyanobacteria bacterium FACHB-DQ100]|nr:DUF4157 domain-containing protein [Cyanobacteria bacterium FACHB-DQ100]
MGVQNTSRVPMLQRKLTIGQPNDLYEQEADRMADQVMRMPERSLEDETEVVQTQPLANSITPLVQQEREDKPAEGEIQAKEGTVPTVTLSLEAQLQEQQGKGQPLPEKTRTFMESRFGRDFSGVRVHTDSNAEQMNRELKAQAFTHQNDVYFASGKYNPESGEGKRLLAHELTHTIQQGGNTLHTQQQTEAPEAQTLKPNTPNIQAAWYNFDIPFTDYQFDPSIEGIKTAASIAKETVVEGFEWFFDKIKSLVSAGIDWLSEKWSSIQKLALSGFETIKNSFTNIIRFIKSPLSYIADAVMSFSTESLATAWATFKGIVTKVWEGFKSLTGNLLQLVNSVWGKISGYATSLLNKVTGLTQNYLFKKLPNALQQMAYSLINKINNLWKSISDGWTKLFNRIKTWIDSALDTVLQFVRRVMSFGINVVIDGIRQFGKLVLFLKDLFTNPRKYVDILAKKSVKAFEGVESHFSSIVSKYFGDSKAATPTANITGTIQRQPSTDSAPEAKGSASWGEIGHGIWEMMGKKWQELKSNPWSIVTSLLLDMVLPVVGNVKDIIQLFKNIKKIVTAPLSAGSLKELWTSFLQILDIPILIYHTVVSILMRTLTLPLIVASFIPHPLVKAIAAAVGYGLLGAFVQAEQVNIGHKLLLLKTGATTKAQKEEAYNRIADSFIALAMAVVIIVIMIILHFLAQVAKGIYNFVKGKIFSVKEPPVELKGGSSSEGKGGKSTPEEGKAGEAKGSKEGLPSEDGKRKIKINEEGRCEVCASPCDEIRKKYASVMTPEIEGKVKAIESNPTLTEAQRIEQLKPIEQELANLKGAPVQPEKVELQAEIDTTKIETGEAKANPKAGEPGSPEHKALRWKEYQQRTGGKGWSYERWSKQYDINMKQALQANKAVDAFHKQLGWGKREATVPVEGVDRRLDIADVSARKGIEYKTGETYATQDILWEVARDEILVRQGWDITWVFEGTASKPLLTALEKAKIKVQFR